MEEYSVTVCPYCGGREMIETLQSGYAALTAVGSCRGASLYHSVCRRCGSIARSYVKNPEKLIRRRDRKKED